MYGTRLLRRVVNTLRENWTAAERTATVMGWEYTPGRLGRATVCDPRIRARAIARERAMSRERELSVSGGRWAA